MRELVLVTIVGVLGCGGSANPPIADAPPGQSDAPPGQSDAPPGQPDAPPGGLTCAAFCGDIMAHCTGANLQFATTSDCLSSCATWDIGDVSDDNGNTLGCRTYHAGVPATASPDIHCRPLAGIRA